MFVGGVAAVGRRLSFGVVLGFLEMKGNWERDLRVCEE